MTLISSVPALPDYPCTFVKNQLIKYVKGLILDSLFYFIDLFVYLDTNTTLSSLPLLYNKSWSQIVSALRLCSSFLNIDFVILGPLHGHMNFRISWSNSAKQPPWDFDQDCIESVDQFGEDWYHNNTMYHSIYFSSL